MKKTINHPEGKRVTNWEKISVYIACLSLVITLWSSLTTTQRDISDIKERIVRLEVKVDKLESK